MNYDLIIIGAGPGGYVAAIRAAKLGMNVAVIEKENLGGICLNWGCIPTKALLKSAEVFNYFKHSNDYGISVSNFSADFDKIIDRSRDVASMMNKGIEYLFKTNNITVIKGFCKLISKNTVSVIDNETKNENSYSAKNIIIATGASSKNISSFPQDGKYILGYRDALSLKELPKSMAIIGSGAIGTEFAFFYQSLGCNVTLIEFLPEIVPLEDEEISRQLARSFKKIGMKIFSSTSVTKVNIIDNKAIVHYTDKKGENFLTVDKVLSAVGVTPNTNGIGLEDLNIITEKGKILVDDFYATNIDSIYAIGDVVHGPALAHVASAEAICCVEKIAGLNPSPIDYSNVPSCIYTTPEIASVGITEKEALEKGVNVRIGKFPFTASGKATAAGNRDGFVKLIFDHESDLLLGAHLIGNNISEMISEMVALKQIDATAKNIIKIIHPHPSLSESIMEAAAKAHNESIHI